MIRSTVVPSEARRLPVEQIELRNFRCIERLTLKLATGPESRATWFVLLGENAVGKTSILQAVALALAGEELEGVRYSELLFRKARQKRGLVRLDLRIEASGLDDVQGNVSMSLRPQGPGFERSGAFFWDSKRPGFVFGLGYVFGFGPARWLPDRNSARRSVLWRGWRHRIANLFTPFEPLLDGLSWLEKLPEGEFRQAEEPLLRILDRPESDRLRRRKGKAVLDQSGRPRFLPLRELSAGYQTILAMACEILQVIQSGGTKAREAKGLVLLDEIGSHLHPRWKMRIVEAFRQAFPRMQFIATTHDPLCLRGLEEGEVALMRRDEEGRIEAITDLPDPNELRVDQLLTSRFFGLLTAYDPDLENLYTAYYHLTAIGKEHLTAEQQHELVEVKGKLGYRKQFGSTPREELMYAVIDGLLARELKRDEPTPMADLKQEAVERVRAMWEEQLKF